ncbi:hypothetical protein LXA47_31265 [Massilia sp. P8910]|uniref:hypothetical protein n=1 Tax=Massilia antarctica TaxID=2765360 RepID=UPI001E365667|nr:hypothetical protein [Massilia antarctica]MCE3608051.1 hypothetical protein [Massilia antarctica]
MSENVKFFIGEGTVSMPVDAPELRINDEPRHWYEISDDTLAEWAAHHKSAYRGNFFHHKEIDEAGEVFISWVRLDVNALNREIARRAERRAIASAASNPTHATLSNGGRL